MSNYAASHHDKLKMIQDFDSVAAFRLLAELVRPPFNEEAERPKGH